LKEEIRIEQKKVLQKKAKAKEIDHLAVKEEVPPDPQALIPNDNPNPKHNPNGRYFSLRLSSRKLNLRG